MDDPVPTWINAKLYGIAVFTVAAALVLIGIGTWSIGTEEARVRSAVIDPLGMITSATVHRAEQDMDNRWRYWGLFSK